jgi:hypothetical protein
MPKFYALITFMLFISLELRAQLTPRKFAEVDKDVYCQAPSAPFFEGKLRKSFHFEAAEKELKEVVLDINNYSAREELKALKRQLMFARRTEKEMILAQIRPRLEQMIGISRRSDSIADFPLSGAVSRVEPSADGNIMISMDNLSPGELEVLPPKAREKLGTAVKIQYLYPYDKFEYFVQYDGQDLPIERAVARVQEEFENACERNALEGREDRRRRESPRDSGGSGTAAGRRM